MATKDIDVKKLISANVVAVYPNLDLRTVDDNAIKLLTDMEDDPYGNTIYKNPEKGVKVVLPQRKVEIDITPSRVQVVDVYVQNPEESDLISRYLKHLTEILKPYTAQIYGFNYDFDVRFKNEKKFLQTKFYNLVENTKYEKMSLAVKYNTTSDSNDSYLVKFDDLGNHNFKFSINYETGGDIRDNNVVRDKFVHGYKVAENIINGIA